MNTQTAETSILVLLGERLCTWLDDHVHSDGLLAWLASVLAGVGFRGGMPVDRRSLENVFMADPKDIVVQDPWNQGDDKLKKRVTEYLIDAENESVKVPIDDPDNDIVFGRSTEKDNQSASTFWAYCGMGGIPCKRCKTPGNNWLEHRAPKYDELMKLCPTYEAVERGRSRSVQTMIAFFWCGTCFDPNTNLKRRVRWYDCCRSRSGPIPASEKLCGNLTDQNKVDVNDLNPTNWCYAPTTLADGAQWEEITATYSEYYCTIAVTETPPRPSAGCNLTV